MSISPRAGGALVGLAAVALAAGALTVLVGSLGERERALAGEQVGACYQRPPGTGADVIGVRVDCETPHDLQIVARFPVQWTDGGDPVALEGEIRDECAAGFEAFAGAAAAAVADELVLQRFMEAGPDPERLVVCTAGRADRQPLTDTLSSRGDAFVPQRDPGSALGPVAVTDLQVGDCLDAVEGSVTEVPAVPCGEPHDREVYAVFDLAGGPDVEFPGAETVERDARAGCLEQFEPAVGEEWATSAYDVVELTPSDVSWSQGDREVVCMLYRLDGEPITGRVAAGAEGAAGALGALGAR